MGRIQSSIGLITGVPITDTVDQLISLSARPRDTLVARTNLLQSEQTAVAELTAAVLAVQFAAKSLAEPELLDAKQANSSDSSLLSATVTGDPAAGSFQFTPLAQAQSQQLLSSGLASLDDPLGQGQIAISRGGFVDDGIALEQLNAGQGVARGSIRITDRSGAAAEIDLRFTATIDDVLREINGAVGINVTASADGDAIRLTDNTGQTISNLIVTEVGAGTTAADLGLGGVDVVASQATGNDVLQLYEGLLLSQLNSGNGISLRQGVPDLNVSFRDGSTDLLVDLSSLAASDVRDTATVKDLLDAINAADPARLQAQLSASGDEIELIDLTTDSGNTFAVTSALGGSVAEELGFTNASVGDTISGTRLLDGLKDTLLGSLGGGSGLGTLGVLDLQDRSGASASIDLSSAETLGEVIDAINAAGIGISAQVNTAGNGIDLRDTSGGTGNLQIANGDATNTADKLQLAIDDAISSVDSGSLSRQYISRQTKLADYNGGQGVAEGTFVIVDSQGAATVVDVDEDVQTIGDLLDLINSAGNGVTASINAAGDGIQLVDTAGGSETLRIDASDDNTAADLQLLGEIQTVGNDQVIDGSTRLVVDISDTDTLEDLVENLNALSVPLSASVFNAGGGATPFRLSVTSGETGRAGRLLVDTTGANFSLDEVVAAADARLLFGSVEAGGVVATSSTNQFDSILDGVQLNVNGTSTDPVTITIDASDGSLVSAVETLVNQFNNLRGKLDEHTFFNEEQNTTGLLFGSNEALRVETELSNLFSGRFFGVGDVQSLEQIGISFKDDGTLTLDQGKLQAQFAKDPDSLREFFTNETLGFAAKLDALAETLVGEGNSLLVGRAESLSRRIDLNQERIDFMSERLDRQRELLTKQFFNMETVIAKLQESLSVVQGIQALPPLTVGSAS